MAGRSRKYALELRQRAVRMVIQIRGDHESEWAAMGGGGLDARGRDTGDGA